MEIIGIDAKEPEEWQCCGTVYPLAQDEIGTRLAAIRVLAEARREQRDLLTLCSACHHVLKRINHDIKTNEDIRFKANNSLAWKRLTGGKLKLYTFWKCYGMLLALRN